MATVPIIITISKNRVLQLLVNKTEMISSYYMRKITIKYICISTFTGGNLHFYEVIKHVGTTYIETMKNSI